MKITYTVMPIGHSVRSIEGALAARQVVKTTLKNLKRWYARLRRGTTDRAVGFDQQNHPNEITVSCDERATTTMIVDQEESRNRANENLENELRERLANNNKSVVGDDDDDDGDR
ncbi:rho gtpase activating [Lasius niger]|uniref:Rho gtpase activating n=1 Tax=Lasius niger TaxID=67767 RepID=A0A0J7LC65_LASNI|nr:rho gtpase activating [Lasius niger]